MLPISGILDPSLPLSRRLPEPLPTAIIEASRNNRLVLFAGSGISAPTNRPDWRSLLRALVKNALAEGASGPQILSVQRLLEEQRIDTTHVKLISSVIQLLLDQQGGDGAYYRCLREALEPGNVTPASRFHDLLLGLKPKAIVTTNYDLCFEIRTDELGARWSLKIVEELGLEPSASLSDSVVYHLHGAESKESSMVLGIRDYTRLYRRSSVALDFLRRLFSRYTILFTGTSLGDEEILGELFESLSLETHWVLVTRGSLEENLFQSLGVNVSSYEWERSEDTLSQNHFGLEQTLSSWVRELNKWPNLGPRQAL